MKVKLLCLTALGSLWLAACSDESKFKANTASKDYSSANGGAGGHATTDGSIGGNNSTTTDQTVLQSLPKFGMLVNHFECGFCHMKLIGDMASTATVPPAREDSVAIVSGDWLVRGNLNINDDGAQINVSGTKKESYTGKDVPATFPIIDMNAALTKARGSLSGVDAKGQPVTIAKSIKGHVVLVGSEAKPIVLSGDVHIEGDLIIKGVYKGVGTIYTSGSIYVPGDLKASRPAFPFPEGKAEAIARAQGLVAANNTDALGMAAGKSVFMGSLDKLPNRQFDKIDPEQHRLDYQNMYTWFGKNEYAAITEATNACSASTGATATLNVIDAFLYARRGISGVVQSSSFSIRGGMIAESFNVVNGSRACLNLSGNSSVHGRPLKNSYIEYDWRIYTGKLPILERLAEVMQAK